MKELQSVALGLVVVFIDVGSPDWVADPVGWILVLIGIAAAKDRLTDYGYLQVTGWVCLGLAVVTWPPEAVPASDETLGWLFSLPTLAFCFLLADSLTDVTELGLARGFRGVSWGYAVVTALPLLPLLGWQWTSAPGRVVAILVNVVLVLLLYRACDEDALRTPPQGGSTSDDVTSPPEGKHKA